MKYIKIGKILNTFGIKGELKVRSFSDFILKRCEKGNEVFIKKDNDYLPFTVKKAYLHKGFLMVQFKDHEDINLVEKYKECDLFVDKNKIEKLDDGYYFYELRDLDVYDIDNNKLGIVIDVEEGTNHNFLKVKKNDGNTSLIPFIPAFIKEVKLDEKRVIITPIEGLL